MPGQFGRIQRWLLAAWALPFIAGFIIAFGSEPKLEPAAKERGAVRLYSNTGSYRELEAKKAAEFGLEKVAAVVNYLLLATAAILAYTTKAVTEYRAERAKADNSTGDGRLRRAQLLFFLHGGLACFFSLTYGVTAYLSLPDITVVETFAMTGALSKLVLCQIAGLLLAVFFLLLALAGVIRDLLP